MKQYRPPELRADRHELTEFRCRSTEQTDWLRRHAESPEAREFYLHLVPEFEPSPTDPLHVVLLMKDIRRTLRV